MIVDALKVNQSNLINTLSKHQLLKVVQLSINVLNVDRRENDKTTNAQNVILYVTNVIRRDITLPCSSRSAAVVNVTVTLFSKHI